MESAFPILSVRNLRTVIGGHEAVKDVSFDLMEGEILGIAGESGSGKTMTALSVMRLVPSAGSIILSGKNLQEMTEKEMRRIRGRDIAMIFQDPISSLSPYTRISSAMTAVMRVHRDISKKEALSEAAELLRLVELPASCLGCYPHELSGGMLQRVMTAMALSSKPRILIADEPTTALDASVQRGILTLIDSLRIRFGLSVIMISHDLDAIAEYTDRTLIMKNGRIVDEGETRTLFAKSSLRHESGEKKIPAAEKKEIVLTAHDLAKTYANGRITALDSVSLELGKGEILGIAGESGSGKTTLLRTLSCLAVPERGSVKLLGRELIGMSEKELRKERRNIQIIFQDSFSALDPLMEIGSLIAEPLKIAGERKNIRERTERMMAEAGLPLPLMKRRPGELSSGERQRACIARALMMKPSVILADEPAASLDTANAEGILSLIRKLRNEGISFIVVSHDLRMLRSIAGRIMILSGGRAIEEGDTEEVFSSPLHPFTVSLIAASSGKERKVWETMTSGNGCPFRRSCPRADILCEKEKPLMESITEHHRTACFHPSAGKPGL